MPLYPYYCDECQKEYEIRHSMSEEPRKKCPECGKNKLKRLLASKYHFTLKGYGWANEGYDKTHRGWMETTNRAQKEKDIVNKKK